MCKRGSMRALIAAALLLVSPYLAAQTDDLSGFYVGASIGGATIELEDEDSTADFKADDTGYKLAAGYRFLPWVAAEVNYVNYGSGDDRFLGDTLEAEFESWSASALGLWPLGPFDVFARAGIAAWDGSLRSRSFGDSVREDNVDPLFGFGAQYRFGRVAVRAELEALLLGFDDDDDDEADGDDWAQMYSIGVAFKF
jgi:OmpA-OmpF porin, OOP family